MAIAGITYELSGAHDAPELFVNAIRPPGSHYLHNRYLVWRHGESRANVEDVIVSTLENGKSAYGLTRRGIRRVRKTAIGIRSAIERGAILFTSPFLRCVESAQIVAEELSIPHVVVTDALRERNFGRLEKKGAHHYARVYAVDAMRPRRALKGAEGVAAVRHRVAGFITHLERTYRGKMIILVTHADVGEILQATLFGLGPEAHRKLPKLKKAECRPLYAY